MRKINVTTEINPLKKVLLHRPGEELLNLTPNNLDELLFDDIPDLEKAQEEHDTFAEIFRDEGIEVLYLEDLMAETLKDNEELKKKFLNQFLSEANISEKYIYDEVYNLLDSIKDSKEFVLKTMSGISYRELGLNYDINNPDRYTAINPMPNLYFTRDPFATIGSGVSINTMYSITRRRESIYGDYIFKYHRDYKDDVKDYYGRDNRYHIEGGDILNINENIVLIGISQRTELSAIKKIAHNLILSDNSKVREVIGINIPNERAYMHLDTVFTQIDHDAFTYHPGIISTFKATKFSEKDGKIISHTMDKNLKDLLKDILKKDDIRLLPCGGGDPIAALREQWTDGSNTLAIAPGKIIVYKRNNKTNEMLEDNGIEVIKLDSNSLTVGRGGPRCMSMPLIREN